MQANIQAALTYAERGFSVIPIRSDKKPFIKWEHYQTTKATQEEIILWFTKWPSAMIGIVTGEISGVLVIDCDNEEAYQRIQELLPEGFLTAIAKTPRGYHIYLVYPAGQQIGNAAGIIPGVDVRGQGGYIIGPPSVNAEGKAYAWLPGLSIDDVALAPLPCELTRALFNNNINKYYRGHDDTLTTSADFFTAGRRDEDVFSLANALVKSKLSEKYIRQVVEIVASNCNPPFSSEEARLKFSLLLSAPHGGR